MMPEHILTYSITKKFNKGDKFIIYYLAIFYYVTDVRIYFGLC